MVQGGGRHATIASRAGGGGAFGAISVVRRARGDRTAARPRPRRAGDRASSGPIALDDLARAAPECGDPQRRLGLSRDDRVVARRASWPTTASDEARASCRPASLRRGSPRGRDQPSRRRAHAWPRYALDDAPLGSAPASAVGQGAGRPERISARLKVDFPEDNAMRVSHEAVYQALYIRGRGGLMRELSACLRSGRTLRFPRARSGRWGKSFATPEIMISERPAEAKDRAVPGHWEGDPILGLNASAIHCPTGACEACCRKEARWWNGRRASRCCFACHRCRATAEDREPRTAPPSRAAARRPCVTPSWRPSRPCPRIRAGP